MDKKRILLIDDELYLLNSIKRLLEEEYSVEMAVGGLQAISLLEQNKGQFDLVITDLNMPDINGAKLYLHILKNYPGLEKRIIFMTGGAYSAFIEEFAINNTNPCIKKPFSDKELNRVINIFFSEVTKADNE